MKYTSNTVVKITSGFYRGRRALILSCVNFLFFQHYYAELDTHPEEGWNPLRWFWSWQLKKD